VIEMSVRQDYIVDRFRIDRERLVVAVAQLVRALKNAAIYEQSLAVRFHEIFGSGNRARRAKKRKLRHKPAIVQKRAGRGS
jgi:hypothetical protein